MQRSTYPNTSHAKSAAALSHVLRARFARGRPTEQRETKRRSHLRRAIPESGESSTTHHPLINRDFALLWSGQVITDLGSVIFTTTLVIWIGAGLAAGESWAPLAVSSVLVAQALPQVVLRPLAGVLVDRSDVRQTMLRMDALRAALIGALTLLMLMPMPPLWRLAAIDGAVLVVSASGQFFNPSLFALLSDLVPEAERARASGWSETTWNVATVVGPPLAAPLFFGVGAQWALVLDALSFAVSYLTLRAMRAPPRIQQPTGRTAHVLQDVQQELKEGLVFCARSPIVRAVTLSLCVAMLGAGIVHALEFFFVTENLHASPAFYGLISPAFGGGSIVGALLAGYVAPRVGVARTFALSMLGVGLALVVLARQTSLVPALGIYVLFGVVNSGANVALLPLLLGATPRALSGRVNALFFTAISAVSLASSAAAGYLDSTLLHGVQIHLLDLTFGPIDTLLTAAGACICVGGVYAWMKLPH
ncbi:MAG TPA: MFS transporter [Ktedonobacterales bacterium]|nr:MFS transporter [Ktedonobacterales bacterium]